MTTRPGILVGLPKMLLRTFWGLEQRSTACANTCCGPVPFRFGHQRAAPGFGGTLASKKTPGPPTPRGLVGFSPVPKCFFGSSLFERQIVRPSSVEMARGRRVLSAACGALAAATCLRRGAFVPGPVRDRVAPLAAASAAAAFGPPALADEIGDAAKKLAADSYAFAKEVDWNSGIYLQAPGKFQPLEAVKAIDKMIVMGS